jgi:hypothetical protein
MRVRSWLLCAATLGACSFPGAGQGDDGIEPSDGPVRTDDAPPGTPDAPDIDAPPPPPDAPPPDALPPCPSGLPSSCGGGGVLFECAGSITCYAFCPSGQTHANAEGRCTGWGGHLASLASVDEQNCVVARFLTQGLTGDVWMGLRQNGGGTPTEGWGYLDGTPYTGFMMWHTGQPDDYDMMEGNNEEQCGDMEAGWTWDWNDESCGDSQGYVCERPRS